MLDCLHNGRYVLAVSGGVDSVVLLDMLSRQSGLELVVAHFDHGIRGDSVQDAVFVSDLAKKYNLPFETRREELGINANEETARDRRYDFLRSVAKKHDAKLITAHHADDVIETIVINLSRGTGWRGLAVLDSDIIRPLTNLTKVEVINYANEHNLTWHEDSTNSSDVYLRNRIRSKLVDFDSDKKSQLLGLWAEQKSLKRSIDGEVTRLVGDGPVYSRYFFTCIDQSTGVECLRYIVGARLTRPQLIRALFAIKTMLSGKTFQAGDGVSFRFAYRNFMVELIK
ncbi:MAG: tRNA lysidine(34) synthetase TilS [Candidatus Saccharibacteria bacterium]